MMAYRFLATFLVAAFLHFTSVASQSASAPKVVTCYYGSWANGRSGNGRFGVSDIPTNLCTHVIYSFLAPTAEGEIIFLDAQRSIQNKSSFLTDFVALKQRNSGIKLLVALGGWAASSDNFTIVVNNETLRANLVRNSVAFLQQYGLDGLDLDWEYPNDRGGVPSDVNAYVTLMRELREAFDSASNNTYLLTGAFGATQSRIDTSYNVTGISRYLDYIHLMTYDFNGQWNNYTGVNAPLYPQVTDTPETRLNVNESVNAWLASGAPRSKLVVGLATYGRTFTLADPANNGTGAPATGGGVAGPYTAEAGTYSYLEICESQRNESGQWSVTEVPGNYAYASRGNFWVGYDSEQSINAKGRYAAINGLGGIFFWSVENDDFLNSCNRSAYPLISQAVAGLNSAVYVVASEDDDNDVNTNQAPSDASQAKSNEVITRKRRQAARPDEVFTRTKRHPDDYIYTQDDESRKRRQAARLDTQDDGSVYDDDEVFTRTKRHPDDYIYTQNDESRKRRQAARLDTQDDGSVYDDDEVFTRTKRHPDDIIY